jgi:hypothetical protein
MGGDIVRIPKHPPPRNAGPDLSGRAPVDPRRILASLERGGVGTAEAPVARRRVASAGAAVLIALAGVLGWAAYHGAAPRIAPRQPAPALSSQQRVAAEPSRHIATANPAQAPAAIINDTLAQSGPAPAAPRQSWLDAVPALAPPAPPLPPPSSKSRPARPHAAQAVHGRRVASHHPAAPTPHEPAAHAAPTASAAPDSDVVLLTALVAHANKQAAAPAKAPAPAVADPATGGSNRDVVLPKENESTESLLQRCKQLGFIEGMLCRSRICAGHADSAACAK